jgi:thiosulfate/3-mercaptopyruvate sulfurtransferase
MIEPLVSTDWLERNRRMAGLIILDCTWHLPESGKRGIDDFEAGHIPGAQFFDLEKVSDPRSPFVNMLPSAEHFAEAVGGLGIGNGDQVVVYDRGYVSARVWWMFRVFGNGNVRVLDGGWRRWVAEARAVERGAAARVERKSFATQFHPEMVADRHEVYAALTSNAKVAVVDARTKERFTGEQSSGYPGVPGGHMPGAINAPWGRFFEQAGDFRFVDRATAERVFREVGVDTDAPIITTCGSGVTAAILGLMLERTGRSNWKLYDGSWHEWAQQPELPKATG